MLVARWDGPEWLIQHVLDAAMFSTVRIGEGGGSIEWVDEELGADTAAWRPLRLLC